MYLQFYISFLLQIPLWSASGWVLPFLLSLCFLFWLFWPKQEPHTQSKYFPTSINCKLCVSGLVARTEQNKQKQRQSKLPMESFLSLTSAPQARHTRASQLFCFPLPPLWPPCSLIILCFRELCVCVCLQPPSLISSLLGQCCNAFSDQQRFFSANFD